MYIAGPKWDRRIVEINPKKNIGIAMTGGIDSWVLYNLLPSNVKIFSIVRADGFDSVERIKHLTGRDDIITIDEPTTVHHRRVREGLVQILEQYDIDELYTGVNHIPPLAHFPEFEEGKPNRPWTVPDGRLVCPFLHLHKYHIIDLANQYNINLSRTQSCLTLHDGHCGTCWQCRERKWGFDQISS